ncbi:MAG: ribosome rescue GTPase HflX [Pseudomonadota bacterium]
MFERPQVGERAVLVHMEERGPADPDELREFHDLVTSAGAQPVEFIRGSRRSPDPRVFLGAGKLEEVRHAVENHDGEVVIFDNPLSPSQERNLEAELECRVLDRTGLILDIFAQRARSHEGKLQVELAQLRHLSTRLVRGWTHLERQKGGIGLRGPGETQLETDRRLLNNRVAQLQQRLKRVEGQRQLGRRARHRADTPTISLVGYTNAGKSTLFNALTRASVYVRDQLFATLDPTLRRLELPDGNPVVLADTVGFISKLPHELVAAFKSTLQETVEADLLLHVVDAAGSRQSLCVHEVERVLAEIGADEVPQVQVFNKIDLTDAGEPRLQRDESGRIRGVWLSARSGVGMDLLLEALQENFQVEHICHRLRLTPADGRLRAILFEHGQVLEEGVLDDGGWDMKVQFVRREYERLVKHEPELERHVVG